MHMAVNGRHMHTQFKNIQKKLKKVLTKSKKCGIINKLLTGQ